MPYTPTAWVSGTTPVDAPEQNNLETQYTEATNSLEQDLFSAFVLSGLVATKDGVTATQLDVTAGIAFVKQTDNTLRRRAPVSSTQTTLVASATYYLYLQPDGTWYWSTANTPAANSLLICQVTTDASGNILTVTDKRSLATTLFAGMAGTPQLPGVGVIAPASFDTGLLSTDGLGTLSGKAPSAPSAPTPATAASSGATYKNTVLGDSPLRYYRLDETSGTTVNDLGSNAQTGTMHNSPTLGVAGAILTDSDTAMTFNGTSSYISAAATGLPTGNAAWSIECWFKISANPSSTAVLANFGTWGTTRAAPHIGMMSTGGVYAGTFSGDTAATSAVSLNTWHHAVATWDGTTLRIYLDGVAGPTATPGALSVGTTGVAIAATQTAVNFFTGSLDEVAIYGSTLSATQISADYSIGAHGPGANVLPGVGTYQYAVTCATALSETVASAPASVTTTAGNQKVALNALPLGPTGTTKRNIYRTIVGGSALLLLTTIADNTTTSYTDASPDSALGAAQSLPANAGALARWGGQATVGAFGMPLIVAQTLGVHVTSTAQQHVFSWTPPASGIYRISLYVDFSNSASSTLTAQLRWTSVITGFPTAYFTTNYPGTTGPFVLNGFSVTPGTLGIAAMPVTVYASSAGAIDIYWTDSAGSPSDYISVLVERLY